MMKNKIVKKFIPFYFLLLLVFIYSNAWAEKKQNLNILFITFDTIRTDHIGCYGYKKIKTSNIDRIAKEGCLFEKAFAPVPLTFPSHASMLTGLYPPTHGVKNNGTYALPLSVTTLTELLKKEDYKTAAFISAYVLDKRFGLDQGFDFYEDDLITNVEPKLSQKERRAETVTKAAFKWLEMVGEEKFFLWVHYFDPHEAYQPPAPFSKEYASNLYDGEIAYADHWFGKLLDKIQKLNLNDHTLIVLAGDHGEGLGDHHEKTHGIFLYDTTLWVPLIISCPKILPRSTRISNLVRLIDIAPTILDILSIKKPEYMQGVSLLPLMKKEEKKLDLNLYCETIYPKSSHNWSPLEGIRTQKWKFIYAPIKELYRLDKDPEEKINLFEKEKTQAEWMENILAKIKKEITPKESQYASIEMDKETKKRLKSLGYVWAPQRDEEKGKYPDPKKMIKILELTDKGAEYFAASEYEKAIPIFKKVLEINPDDTEAYVTLGHIYEALGEDEKSINAFEQALRLEPENLRIYIQLGVSLMKYNKFEEGLAMFRKALDFNPKCKEAYFNMGLYHFQSQDWPKAKELFKKVLDIDPRDSTAHNYLSVVYQRLADYTNSISEAMAVLDKDPNNSMALLNLGSAYHATEKINEAQEVLERALQLKPDFSKAHYFLGLIQFQKNKIPEAVNAFKNAIKYDPKSSEAHFNLGYIYIRQDELEMAYKEFQKALDINPDFIPARQMLQKIQPLVKKGERE